MYYLKFVKTGFLKYNLIVMKKIIITLICLFIGLSANAKQIKFAQVSDANYNMANENNSQILDWAIRSINNNNPDFTVFLGDNIEKSKEDNLTDFLKKIKTLKSPYYIVVGNKDSYRIGGINKNDFWKIIRKNNKNNKKSEKSYYSFEINSEFLGVVLDGAVPFVQGQHGIYPEEQLKWLDSFLKENKNKKIIIFQHFPIVEPSEKKLLTTLEKEKYQEVLDKHKNVVIISSGHFDTSKVTVDEKGISHISSPSLVTPDYIYNIVTVDYKKFPFFKPQIKDIKVTSVDLQ